MKSLKPAFFALILLLGSAAYGIDERSLDFELQVRISNLDRAAAPELFRDHILFSYQSTESVRLVGIAFDYESYRIVHPYSRNGNGIFVLALPVEEAAASGPSAGGAERRLLYRIVVDGLWMADPRNPQREPDAMGNGLSAFAFPTGALPESDGPIVRAPRSGEAENAVTRWVEFRYSAPAGQRIFLTGSFNSWDPFMHRMTETRPGEYRVSIRMTPGTHYYYFARNGLRFRDPGNSRIAFHPDGYPVSILLVE